MDALISVEFKNSNTFKIGQSLMTSCLAILCDGLNSHIYRVAIGQGKVREIQGQGKVREF